MGRAYTYRCERCGYQDQFNEGHGFKIHPQSLQSYLNNTEIIFHYKTHKLLQQLGKKQDGLMVNAGFKVFKCPGCRILYDKVDVVVLKDGKEVHKSEFRCSRCRARLKLTNIHRLKKAVCPACNKPSFRIDLNQQVLWD